MCPWRIPMSVLLTFFCALSCHGTSIWHWVVLHPTSPSRQFSVAASLTSRRDEISWYRWTCISSIWPNSPMICPAVKPSPQGCRKAWEHPGYFWPLRAGLENARCWELARLHVSKGRTAWKRPLVAEHRPLVGGSMKYELAHSHVRQTRGKEGRENENTRRTMITGFFFFSILCLNYSFDQLLTPFYIPQAIITETPTNREERTRQVIIAGKIFIKVLR